MKRIANRIALTVAFLFILCQSVSAAQLLIPGGQLIGLELGDHTVTVAAFDDALGADTRAAGLKVGDRIIRVDTQPVQCAQDIRQALLRSDGQVELSVLRDGKAKTLKLRPKITSEGPRLGVYLKQSVTGVGTVTWYDPDTGRFAALGHGVNNSSGALLDMREGTAYNATVMSVKKGVAGEPGQLLGTLNSAQPIGNLTKNTVQGIFGTADQPWQGNPLPIAEASQIRTGPATIRSTVADRQVQEYSVEILKIYPNAKSGGRNMLLRITDPDLLQATGGIVQGMSGSPLVQDGKLIGAVTHVLVNDPTMGYGIFIENMLEAAG
ncbi:MAG: SpoIVB peptidase [Oscillospiraceae bacterium]|nr:SpoIVB peptidase [Oscillospiraceae bacterium]